MQLRVSFDECFLYGIFCIFSITKHAQSNCIQHAAMLLEQMQKCRQENFTVCSFLKSVFVLLLRSNHLYKNTKSIMRLDENYLERIGTDISGYIIKNPPIHRGIVFLDRKSTRLNSSHMSI